jgi:hypothetical protein
MGLDSHSMSRLTDKYQSYDHFKGISFDEPVFTAAPTRTGSRQLGGNPLAMTNSNFFSDGLNNPTIKSGVLPNQNYYHFEFDNTITPQKNARLLYGSTSTSSTGGTDDVRRTMWDYTPFDRVTGVWVKTPSSAGNFGVGTYPAVVRWLYGTSAMINIGVGLSPNSLPALAIIHSTAEFTAGPIISVYENYTDANSNVIPIEWGKWYFVAIRKMVNEDAPYLSGQSASGTLTYQHYINGEVVNTHTRTTWTKRPVNGIVFGNNNAIFKYDFGVSGWFVTDWSQVGQTQLREIYKYGAPIQAPVKYYDGTNWQDDISAPKIFHSNQWNDVYANKYDGSQWVPI